MWLVTFSDFLVAISLTRESNKTVISHSLSCFSMRGAPNHIKPDNETGYCSQTFEIFCEQFNINHITGILYKSQWQSIVSQSIYLKILKFGYEGTLCWMSMALYN